MGKKIIGVTGNIGCGKSALIKFLKDYNNTHVVSTDDLARSVMSDPANRENITLILGDVFTDGVLDRDKVRSVLYSNAKIKKALEEFVHPLVRQKIDEEVDKTDCKFVFVESALIFEAGWESYFDLLLMVTANDDIRRARLMSNRAMTTEQIDEVLGNQNTSDERFEKADHVIDNSGSLYDLKVAVSKFVIKFLNPVIAVDAGSYDPITFGHLAVLEIARRKYDIVIVLVGVNSKKKCMFESGERVSMVKSVTREMGNVLVDTWEGLTVEYSAEHGATFMIRGIRGDSDMVAENELKEANYFLNPEIETDFIQAPADKKHISSTLVREVFAYSKAWKSHVFKLVPYGILHVLETKKYLSVLHNRFFQFIQRISRKNPAPHDVEKHLFDQYQQSHRGYHNLTHIYEMLQDFDLVKKMLESPDLVEFAIWNHDWFMDIDPKLYSKNEERSAEKAVGNASWLGLPENFRGEKLHSLIMVTDHKHDPATMTHDQKFIADMDLGILGMNEERFLQYERGIREEFNFVPASIFYSIRKGILQGFLRRENIYQTDFFREKYGTQARINLEKLLSGSEYQ